ncbi:MAG TPA: response regulator transcription factor [Pyrinomonadaceae bacterium]|jgi:DNA-binding response OmpR family regulator
MKSILLVEDDRSLGATLRDRLAREGYEVSWVETKQRALKTFGERLWDLVILDVGLPDGSGFEIARHVKTNSSVPIMFMTALGTAENRLEGFEIGAEEFIPKPFHLRELLLRVQHVFERHPVRHHVTCNGRTIELDSRTIVQPDGQREYLAARDFELLELLITSTPRAVSRNEIIDKLWGEDKLGNQRTVDNMIVHLRQSLGDTHSEFIRSVRGVGYQWNVEA